MPNLNHKEVNRMKLVTVTSAVKLNETQLKALKSALDLTAQDEISCIVDPHVIAGMKVSVNGHALDLTVKRQLNQINQG
jgi:F0F1-type ATP synthase delta subunit